jgi:hypothetical protein
MSVDASEMVEEFVVAGGYRGFACLAFKDPGVHTAGSGLAEELLVFML